MKGLQFVLGSGQIPLAGAVGASANILQTASIGVANSGQLIPPWRRPYLIKEIRFVASAYPAVISLLTEAQNMYAVKMSLGNFGITNGYEPIGSFCPSVQQLANTSGYQGALTTLNPSSYSMNRWVLPRPMYVQAGDGIQASFKRFVDGSTFAGSVEMAIVGELVPDGSSPPKTSCIPWISTYANNKVASSMSQALNLQNPFNDRNLNMQRFVGKFFYDQGSGNLLSATGSTQTGAGDAMVRLTDSDRFAITPAGQLRFGEAFDVRSNVLEHRRILPPKGWFQVQFNQANVNSIYFLSMIGWREEALV